MSGDWISVEIGLRDKPKARAIARRLGLDVDTVVGKLIVVWGWADRVSVDGVVDAVVDADVDDLARHDGFALAMAAVGWLVIDVAAQRIVFPEFGSHHGNSAKKRLLKSARQAKYRANKAKPTVDAGVDASVDAPVDAGVDAPESPSWPPQNRTEDKEQDIHRATLAGAACKAMRAAGCINTNPSNLNLIAALQEGVTAETLADTVREGIGRGIGEPFSWAIKTARGRQKQGADTVTANGARAGPPGKQVQAISTIQRMKNEHRGTDSGPDAKADMPVATPPARR